MDKRDSGVNWAQQLEELRVSISRTQSVLLLISTLTAYIIKVCDSKPASLQWVEENVKDYWAHYISPESVTESVEFFISVMLLWLSATIFYNMCLRWTLTYKGWMFEGRGRISLITRVWAITLRALSAGHQGFYSFYKFCPSLPVPTLEETIEKYLISMKPLLTEKEFAELKKNSSDFVNTIGPSLQSALIKKSWLTSNYVTDWWEEFVYLRSRDSLMINSNYFGLSYEQPPTTNMASRAAGQLWAIIKWRKDGLIDNKVPAIKLQKLVPLCPAQYKRLFGTVRIPGEQKDEIETHENSNHVAVFYNERIHIIDVCHDRTGQPYSAKYLEQSFEKIIHNTSDDENSKYHNLAAGTALNRTKWFEVRKAVLADSDENKESIKLVESALMHIWLDDEFISLQKKKEGILKLSARGLHGNGKNIWFDKSVSYIFHTGGHLCINAEHTWADGAVIAHLSEEVNVLEHLLIEYAPDTGKIIAKNEFQPVVRTLTWTNLRKILTPVDNEIPAIHESIAKLSHSNLQFSKFGKNHMKKWRMSPDAICQMAFQLTNFRIRGKFAMTYEAALARVFKDGRTETIRSCTPTAALFIKEMLDKESDKDKRKKALGNAARAHGELVKQAMIGQGVDRHLFALCVASGGLNMPSEFLNKYKAARWEKVNGWELSTSCAPIGFGELYRPNKFPHLQGLAAGFGWTNGFGVGYMINDENISCSVSCSKSQGLDAQVFCDTLADSFLQISEVCN